MLAPTIVVEDSLKRLLAIDDRDAHEDEPVEKRRWKAFAELVDGLDDYWSSDDSCIDLDETDDEADDEAAQPIYCWSETNFSGFQFVADGEADGENIVFRLGQLFKDVYVYSGRLWKCIQ